MTRYSDALFLGIDAEYLIPPAGQTTLTGGYSISELRKLHPQSGQTVLEGTATESGGDVVKFLGLVARIHKYVNAREAKKSFPGCLTVVASGLRRCFNELNDEGDFFSTNFSVSTAFEADKRGSSVGLKGNNLYVEDDVGMAISYSGLYQAILGFAKFVRTGSLPIDPYQYNKAPEGQGMIVHSPRPWTIPEPITLEIMKKSLTFRCLNPTVLTNLQLLNDYRQLETESGDFNKEISNSLFTSTPPLAEVNKSSWPFEKLKYPFLSLEFSLDANYSSFFGEE